jgi:predicted DNA-binding transcriptional regulator AlpA
MRTGECRTLIAANDNAPRARLINLAEAAAYCGVSTPVYARLCPVRPISLGPGKRLERFDVRDLDAWIDGLKGDNDNLTTADSLLAAMN